MSTLSGNPWIVDTAATLTTERVRLLGFRWVGATAAAESCVVTDGAGVVIWESIAAGDNYVESDLFPAARTYKGLIVATIDSGTLYVSFG